VSSILLVSPTGPAPDFLSLLSHDLGTAASAEEALRRVDLVDAVAGNVVNADERGAADQISDGGGDASHEGSFLSRCTPELSSRARSFV